MTAQLSDGEGAHLRVVGLPAIVRADGPTIEFSATQRRILARLGLDAPKPVSLDDLVHAVWDTDPPASARQAIQNQISRMRHSVMAVMPDLIATVGDSYALVGVTDAQLMRDGATAAEQALAAGDARAAFDFADAALGLWRGEPFSEIAHVEGVSGFRRASHAACDGAHDLRLEAALHLGMRSWAHAEAERLVASMPTDERRSSLLARALALTGRRADALAVLSECRRRLRTELGMEPGPYLVAAESDILGGIALPSAAVGSTDAVSPAERLSPPPFMGRDAELREVLRAVAQRRPVTVCGERGSGVSRLLFEARGQLVSLGVKVVLVRAEEHPYSATSLVEELLAELDVSIGPAHSAISRFAAAAAAIDADHPTVFIVDDVQFVGPSGWQAMRAVVAADYGGLILGAHGKTLEMDGQVEVPINSLGPEAIGDMVRHWGIEDPAVEREVFEVSGGNPLAARVVTQALRARQPGADGAPAITDLPVFTEFVTQLVGDRDRDGRHDLQLAAVAGDGYPFAALQHVSWTHPPAPPADLVDVDAHGLLRFRHGAVQAHAYQTLPRGVALDMHYALGIAAQEIKAPAATAARHLVAAAELDPDAAIGAARAAARDATLLGAHADAAEWLARALSVDPDADPARTIAIGIERADALRLSGDPAHLPALMSATREALELGDDALVAAAGFALLQLGGSSPAGDLDEELASLARQVIASISDPQLRAPVQAAASLAWSMTGNAETSRALFDEAEATAVDIAARLRVLPFAYLAAGRPVDLPRRAALAGELVTLADIAQEPVAAWEGAHLQFSVCLQRGDGAGMREALRRMESLISKVGDVGRRWSLLYCSATIAHLDGDPALAESLAAQAFAMFAPVSMPRAAAAYYAQLLPLRLEQGRLADLRPIALAMVTEQPGVTAWHAVAALVLASGSDGAAEGDVMGGDSAAADEDRRQARIHAERALELAQDDFTWLAAHVVGGRAAALIGESELVARYAERLEPWAGMVCWQGTCSYGPVAEVLALLADAAGKRRSAAAYAAQAAELRGTLAG